MEDAQAILASSPWVKTVTPSVTRQTEGQRSGGGRRGGFGGGIPGVGRRGGIGFPGGGGYPGGGGGGGGRGRRDDASSQEAPMLKLRWESAQPIREAELKARDTAAPTIDEGYYAVAVYGVPRRMINGDSKKVADEFKKQAALKRDAKKDLKPSSVQVIERDDGPVIVYLFPRTKEITAEDRRIEFNAKIGRLDFSEPFFTEDMKYQGKLEL
jgi:hypothetical protein